MGECACGHFFTWITGGYCPDCGRVLTAECPHCNKLVAIYQKYCKGCGKPNKIYNKKAQE